MGGRGVAVDAGVEVGGRGVAVDAGVEVGGRSVAVDAGVEVGGRSVAVGAGVEVGRGGVGCAVLPAFRSRSWNPPIAVAVSAEGRPPTVKVTVSPRVATWSP